MDEIHRYVEVAACQTAAIQNIAGFKEHDLCKYILAVKIMPCVCTVYSSIQKPRMVPNLPGYKDRQALLNL